MEAAAAAGAPTAVGTEEEALQRLHDELDGLATDGRASLDIDLPSLAGAKGTGPRLFCGHVPKEVNDEMVRQHFSKWGTVNDVYFPRHKKTLKRRPFCFVTFANKEDAERALAESGLEIAGVPIKNLTMVEDRDKYYTNKHATARQALLQALKQLSPAPSQAAASNPPVASNSSNGLPPATAGATNVTAEQLSNLAAIMALEGVPSDVMLQTLGLTPAMPEMPPMTAAALGLNGAATGGLSALDSTSLLQALASPSLSTQTLSTQTTFDHLRSSLDMAVAMRSAGNSLDLSSLQQGLAGAGGLGTAFDHAHAGHMPTVDSRSTLASADWSNAPSVRTSIDATLLPAATAGFLASAASLGSATSLNSLHTRLSLDAALQLQQAQQQAALLAHAQPQRLSLHAPYAPPLPPAAPQQSLASVMHSGFYQAAAAPAPPPPPQPEVQHSLQSIMQSGLYGGSAGPPPGPPPARRSIHGYADAGMPLAYNEASWGPPQQPQHQQQLGGYSTVLRPSIDRAGLPPLPPRSPNQDPSGQRAGSGSPDALLGMSAGWPAAGQRLAA